MLVIPLKNMNVYHTDGYCSKNGDKSALGGFTVFKNGVLLLSKKLEKRGVTSNECELEGLAHAVKDAEIGDEVVVDSMVCIYWTRSGKPKARMDLQPLCQELKRLIYEKKLDVYWASRYENQAGIYNEEVLGL